MTWAFLRSLNGGAIEGLTLEAERLIRTLDLEDEEHRRWRRICIRIIELAQEYDPVLYRQLRIYLNDQPNLARMRPPGGNTWPGGIHQSYFAQRRRGELPDVY